MSLEQGALIDPGTMAFSLSGELFKNLEAFSGDVFYRPPLISKNAEIRIARRDIVRKARDVERFSEHIRGGLDRKADMVVGATLRVHPQPDFELLGIDDADARKKFIKQCKQWFNNWAYDDRKLCDAEGHYNFGGMMWLSYRNLEGPDGETGGVIHYDEDRRAEYNTRWATFVTIVDPDRIETPPEVIVDDTVFEGKKLDRHGRMIGMWVRRGHPSDAQQALDNHEFVPRETAWGRPMAFHWFNKTRGGQQRGITNLVTILRRAGMFDSFDTSYLGAAAINSELATYIRTRSSTEVIGEALAPARRSADQEWAMFGQKIDYYDKRKFRIGRGGQRLPVLPPDDEVVMASVNRAIDDPTPMRNGFLREYSSATGVPFSGISQNYSEANYSSERASKLDNWQGVIRNRIFFCAHPPSLIYSSVIEEAIAEGWIYFDPAWPPFQENRAAYCACAWTGPGMGWIDPYKEAMGYKTLLDMRVTSRGRIAASAGDDILEIFDELATEEDEADDRDLVLEPLDPGQVDPSLIADDPSASPKPKKKKSGTARDGDGDGQTQEGK